MSNKGQFSSDNQPAGRGRPKGSRNKATQKTKDFQALVSMNYYLGTDENMQWYNDLLTMDPTERVKEMRATMKSWEQDPHTEGSASASIVVNIHEGVQPTPSEESSASVDDVEDAV